MSGFGPHDDDRDEEYDAEPAFGDGQGMMGSPLGEDYYGADTARGMTPQQGYMEGTAPPGFGESQHDAPFGDDRYEDRASERASMSPRSSLGSESEGSDFEPEGHDPGAPGLQGSLLNSGFPNGPPVARESMPSPPPPPGPSWGHGPPDQDEDDSSDGHGYDPDQEFDPNLFSSSRDAGPDDDEGPGYGPGY
ncbi:hypothetical protein B0A55_00637 [Friedmanniomyces simplex]|uniref:Uncharacterized protein n=1 Tax=Friedmanniomyces simplex TaxID=329884 RepID=A0A4V5NKA5_9PEZI|nr:hypothetical protein B0A55_00637 [Friedmanniomyces simplex]